MSLLKRTNPLTNILLRNVSYVKIILPSATEVEDQQKEATEEHFIQNHGKESLYMILNPSYFDIHTYG